ncbi:uncharacterized protein LOC141936538 [Strix uralensis]|uniref:uncharacterized protein LOC141936538 n=1 Tax=Strix uralensis TaxID=36305 RepID=UPI003DA6D68B
MGRVGGAGNRPRAVTDITAAPRALVVGGHCQLCSKKGSGGTRENSETPVPSAGLGGGGCRGEGAPSGEPLPTSGAGGEEGGEKRRTRRRSKRRRRQRPPRPALPLKWRRQRQLRGGKCLPALRLSRRAGPAPERAALTRHGGCGVAPHPPPPPAHAPDGPAPALTMPTLAMADPAPLRDTVMAAAAAPRLRLFLRALQAQGQSPPSAELQHSHDVATESNTCKGEVAEERDTTAGHDVMIYLEEKPHTGYDSY